MQLTPFLQLFHYMHPTHQVIWSGIEDAIKQYEPPLDREFFETHGNVNMQSDLEDLLTIMLSGDTDLMDNTRQIHKFLMGCPTICSWEFIRDIPKIRAFKTKYPALYHTFEVWAWG